MGPNIEKVERTSQATPLATDFMRMLQGWLSNPEGTPAGPAQRTGVGSGSDQYMNSPWARLGGVNTAAGVADYTPQLTQAVTEKSNLGTDRGAAQIRESMGAAGNRFSSSLARTEGQFRSEAGTNLDQLIAQILTDQGARQTQAQQFDVNANFQALAPFLQAMQQGVIPEEIIATPGWGSQLISGAMQGLGAYVGGGGRFGLGGKSNAGTPQFQPTYSNTGGYRAPFGTFNPPAAVPSFQLQYGSGGR